MVSTPHAVGIEHPMAAWRFPWENRNGANCTAVLKPRLTRLRFSGRYDPPFATLTHVHARTIALKESFTLVTFSTFMFYPRSTFLRPIRIIDNAGMVP